MKYIFLGLILLVYSQAMAGLQAPSVSEGWLVSSSRMQAFVCGSNLTESGDLSIYASAGNGKLFNMPDLPMRELSFGTSQSGRSLDFSWASTGSKVWREDQLRCVFVPSHGISPVVGIDYNHSAIGEWASNYQLMLSAGIHVPINQCVFIMYQYDLPISTGHLPFLGQRPLLGVDYLSASWLAALRMNRVLNAPPSWLISMHYRFANSVSIGFLAEPSSSSWGSLLSVRRGPILLRSSHLVHSALGMTHRFEISVHHGGAG